jgi:hypothetical protein
MKKLLTFLSIFVFCFTCFSQVSTDTLRQVIQVDRNKFDTTIWYIKKTSKSDFWGNSTYLSTSINFARNKEFDFNIGRTNGISTHYGKGMGNHKTYNWGAGYGLLSVSKEIKQTIKLFYQYDYFPFIILGNFGVRGDYIYNITDKQNYLRPSIGLNILYFDISYNYSFLLNGNKSDNIYNHGFLLRVKYYLTKNGWTQRRYKRRYG